MSDQPHEETEPSRDQVDQLTGAVLLEFGAAWCPHCQAVQPQLEALLQSHPTVQRIQIEDGKGKRLGRSFRVKLWPTLVFMRDGQVLHQADRPSHAEIERGFELITEGPSRASAVPG